MDTLCGMVGVVLRLFLGLMLAGGVVFRHRLLAWVRYCFCCFVWYTTFHMFLEGKVRVLRPYLLLTGCLFFALLGWVPGIAQERGHDPFHFTVARTTHGLILSWQPEQGYHLNQGLVRITVPKQYAHLFPDLATHPLLVLPAPLQWPWQGKHYRVHVRLVVSQAASGAFFVVHYQGCTAKGQCLPPFARHVYPAHAPLVHEIAGLDLPESMPFWLFLLSFFGFGLLLAFTPCVWPLVPIIAAMVLAKGRSGRHGYGLTFGYCLGICLSYGVLGLVFASLGVNLHVQLQQPWVIYSLAFILGYAVLLMFEVCSLPTRWLQGGSHGVFSKQRWHFRHALCAGFLASLVLSPCLTPPLMVALTMIAHWGDRVYGMVALFALGMGVSVPLFLVPVLGQRMPKMTGCTRVVKELIALLLLYIMVHLLAFLWIHVWPSFGYVCVTAVALWRVIRVLVGVYWRVIVGLLLVGLSVGGWYYQHGFSGLSARALLQKPALPWIKVASEQQLGGQLLAARGRHPVLLYFYADWCHSCQQLAQDLWSDKHIVAALKGWKLVKVDVTEQAPTVQSLMRVYKVLAPPTLLIINRQGALQVHRLVGLVAPERLLPILRRLH
jgi:thioredoxin:protein disulfide reductase